MSAVLAVCLVAVAIAYAIERNKVAFLRAALHAQQETGVELGQLAQEFKASSDLWRNTCIDLTRRLDPQEADNLMRAAAALDAEAALARIALVSKL